MLFQAFEKFFGVFSLRMTRFFEGVRVGLRPFGFAQGDREDAQGDRVGAQGDKGAQNTFKFFVTRLNKLN
ncbi:hypothetical protein AVO42_00435 [Thiomicrospira sp. XS5]|nr:hypothetical protein AVO42_00435 [Thiomicrospira sp. XS5]